MAKRGRPYRITDEQRDVLLAIVEATPGATLEEIRGELKRQAGIEVHRQTIEKVLKEAGLQRRAGASGLCVAQVSAEEKRYGYTQAHRRLEPEQSYPSCLTNAEWALVEDLFDNEGGRGKPPRYTRRLLVDACCYVVRTGSAWRMLPKGFPPWQNVYRTFRRWSEQGRFERMHDRLRGQWREREGRNEDPSAAVLDAQSTRSSPQGGERGYDAGKKI